MFNRVKDFVDLNKGFICGLIGGLAIGGNIYIYNQIYGRGYKNGIIDTLELQRFANKLSEMDDDQNDSEDEEE